MPPSMAHGRIAEMSNSLPPSTHCDLWIERDSKGGEMWEGNGYSHSYSSRPLPSQALEVGLSFKAARGIQPHISIIGQKGKKRYNTTPWRDSKSNGWCDDDVSSLLLSLDFVNNTSLYLPFHHDMLQNIRERGRNSWVKGTDKQIDRRFCDHIIIIIITSPLISAVYRWETRRCSWLPWYGSIRYVSTTSSSHHLTSST